MRRLLAAVLLALWALPVAGPAAASYAEGQTAFAAEDHEKAREIWLKAAREGDPQAQYALGYLYNQGLGLQAPRHDLARKWFGKAARQSHTDAMYALARLYRDAPGEVRENLGLAALWFRQAAQIGDHREAMFILGRMYFNGTGLPLSYGDALHWYRRAARKEHPGALYIMGAIHEAGWGVKQDLVEAYVWYKRAGRYPAAVLKEYDAEFDVPQALTDLKKRMNSFQIKRAERRWAAIRQGGGEG